MQILKCVVVKREDVIGKKCFEIKERSGMPCSSDGQPCPLEKVRKTGKRVEHTHFHQDPGGDIKEHYVFMYPLRSESQDVQYYIEIARDVTE